MRRIAGVGEFDIVARVDQLIGEADRGHAVGVGDLDSDGNRLAGGRLLGRMVELPHLGGGVGGIDGIGPAGRGAAGPPAPAQVVIQGRVDQFHGIAGFAADDGPGESELVGDLVLGDARGVDESHFLAIAVQQPAVGSQRGSEVLGLELGRALGDDEISPASQHRARGEGVLDAVGELPAGEVNGGGAGVVEFDELDQFDVHVGRVVDLVDDDGADLGPGVIAARGAPQHGAGLPLVGVVPVSRGSGLIPNDEGVAAAGGFGIPGAAIVEPEDGSLVGVWQLQGDSFAGVGERAGVLSSQVDAGPVAVGEVIDGSGHDDVAVGREHHVREGEIDAVREPHAGQVECNGADVLEFDELGVAPLGGLVVYLRHPQAIQEQKVGAGLDVDDGDGGVHRQGEGDVAAVGVGLVDLDGQDVVAADERVGGDGEGAFDGAVADVAAGQGAVGHVPRGHADPEDLRAVEVEDRTVVEDGGDLELGDVRGIGVESEVRAKVVGQLAEGQGGFDGNRQAVGLQGQCALARGPGGIVEARLHPGCARVAGLVVRPGAVHRERVDGGGRGCDHDILEARRGQAEEADVDLAVRQASLRDIGGLRVIQHGIEQIP
ncbi:MAG: hypothetical protein BWX88_04884 [Planctomycetes bacterium ADurb.Bin126]|nr:MAG: hypothetical protein BWX88_04884 [Planctomycetes bacterium ADurb.Bin126]